MEEHRAKIDELEEEKKSHSASNHDDLSDVASAQAEVDKVTLQKE